MVKMHTKRHQPRNYLNKISTSSLPEHYEDGREMLRKLGYEPLIRVPTFIGNIYSSRNKNSVKSTEEPLSRSERQEFFNYLNSNKDEVQIYRDPTSLRHRFFIYLTEDITTQSKSKKITSKRKTL